MTDSEDDMKPPAGSAKGELQAIGGVESLRNGEWFLKLVGRSLSAYVRNANSDYLRAKYPKMSDDAIAAKLISLAARNAALVGGTAGAAVSADEIAVLFSMGLAAPASIAVAIGAVGVDIISVTHIQLRLIASLACLYGKPLDPDDPEDVLIVIKYFFFGSLSDAAGEGAAKLARGATHTAAKFVFSGDTLKAVQYYGRRVGMKILQRTIKSVALPIVSIGLGAGSNFIFTRQLGRMAKKDMKARASEIALHRSEDALETFDEAPSEQDTVSSSADGFANASGPKVEPFATP